ncbi:MAG: hypothetical protein HYV95_11515 [Opitutae bacterium]|nr:hypothetical protein [Opitutae bacterium]
MNIATATVTSATSLSPQASAYRAILWGGLLCGVLDISAACIQAGLMSGASPGRVLQGVASGLLGRSSFEGGAATAALGLLMHFCVAFSWTVVFHLLSRRLPALPSQVLLVGPLYGLVVFCGMNYLTLPFLSWFRSLYLHTPIVWVGPMGWIQAVIHMFCVGLPIVFAARRWGA